MTPMEIVQLSRAVLQLGVTAEQFVAASNNPDMTDEQLAEHIAGNSDEIRDLRDRDHG